MTFERMFGKAGSIGRRHSIAWTRAAAVPENAVAPLELPDNIDDHLTVTYDLMLLASAIANWIAKDASLKSH